MLRDASGAVTVKQSASSSARWKKIGSIGKMKFGSSGNCEGALNQHSNQSQIHVAGKMCSNGASDDACLYTQQGKKGTNQDAMLVWEVSAVNPLPFLTCMYEILFVCISILFR